MRDNQVLREQLRSPVQTQAQRALDEYLATGTGRSNFAERFPAEIQNGEGIVGYQYLHGTNRDSGDFGFEGTTDVRPRGDGTYEVPSLCWTRTAEWSAVPGTPTTEPR